MIPGFQKFMRPLLEYAANAGGEFSMREAVDFLCDKFQFSADEKTRLLPSGKKTVVYDRIGWARTYMLKALLLEPCEKKGSATITERGKIFLSNHKEDFGMKELREFPEFVEFQSRSNSEGEKKNAKVSEEEPQDVSMTADEALDFGEAEYKKTLSAELLEKIKSCSSKFFEELVVKLLVAMGYGGSFEEAADVVGKSGDGGIDGVIKEDKLGLDVIYVQAKKWASDNIVGRPEIQKFIGAIDEKGAGKGVFFTTSRFSKVACESARLTQKKIILIDGERLSRLMIEYDVGITVRRTIKIKQIDSDFFEEE